jgi:hypothetical protein
LAHGPTRKGRGQGGGDRDHEERHADARLRAGNRESWREDLSSCDKEPDEGDQCEPGQKQSGCIDGSFARKERLLKLLHFFLV